jgi:hypothetical protein
MKFRLLAAIFAVPALSIGQVTIQDAPPVDASQLLSALKALREQNEAGIKARKQAAYNQVMQAAASGTAAAAFWKEAVKEVQFAGADHSASKISDWKDGDGDALNSKECQNAARLHLYWLGLSLQHAMGTETKTMLQNIIEFTKQIRAAEELIDRVDAAIDRAKDRKDRDKTVEEQNVKRVHDQILRTSVAGSPVARLLRLGELLNDSGRARRAQRADGRPEEQKPTGSTGWEMTPGNVDGIYNSIILPEFRATKDPRLMEYWDLRIKQETEKAAEKKLDVEQRDWLQIRRPNLLWSRTQDMIILGQKNRAITEMFNLLKANPQHPSANAWISAIETALLPTFQAPATPEPAPAGVVPAPVSVPPATAPSVDPFRLNPTKTPAQ